MTLATTVMTGDQAVKLVRYYRREVERHLEWFAKNPTALPNVGPGPATFAEITRAAFDGDYVRSPTGFSFEKESGFERGLSVKDYALQLVLPQLPDVRRVFAQRNRER